MYVYSSSRMMLLGCARPNARVPHIFLSLHPEAILFLSGEAASLVCLVSSSISPPSSTFTRNVSCPHPLPCQARMLW
jgi:hypothetical protein